MRIFVSLLLLVTLFSVGCDNGRCDPDDQAEKIAEYVADQGLTTQQTESGIHYIIRNEGSLIRPIESSTVSVTYVGTLISDGSEFDRSDSPTSFGLSEVIDGWTEGLQLIKKGGEITLIIPCQLGYGTSARTGIPAGSALRFEVTLLDVN